MRIVIDMQGAQTESRFSTIGRFTMALAQHVIGNRGSHEILLAVNGLFPETIEPIRAAFEGLLPQENIRVWYAPGPVRECEPGNSWRRAVAERIREAFLASLRPDIVHVISLYEGYVDDAVTSLGVFAPHLKTVVNLYALELQVELGSASDQSSAYRAFQQRKGVYLQRAKTVVQVGGIDARCDEADGINWKYSFDLLNAIKVYEEANACETAGNLHDDDCVPSLLQSIAGINQCGKRIGEHEILETAKAIALNHPKGRTRTLFVDISDLVQKDLRTGIQRVTRSILSALQSNSPSGYQVSPVYATQMNLGYRHARLYTQQFADGDEVEGVKDDMIDPQPGDVFLGLDFAAGIVAAQYKYLTWIRNHGVRVCFVVYDLLPIKLPEAFPPEAREGHRKWLQEITEFDGALCISRAVQADLDSWIKQSKPKRLRPFKTDWFHLGADIENSGPSKGFPSDAEKVLMQLSLRPSFLMVGTVEPRKGHVQVLDAFEYLWRNGVEANLVIAGKRGWMVDNLIDRLRDHSELNSRLFWLENISDEYLQKLYSFSQCLIAASYDEGFGLPLIEAAHKNIPILARDIDVFREIAGPHATYFNANSAEKLASQLKEWLLAYKNKKTIYSGNIAYLNWRQSAENLLDALQLKLT